MKILNKLSCPVTIETDDNDHATISSGTAKAVVFGLSPADFPEAEAVKPELSFSIKASIFDRLARHGGYCASNDESRKVLQGVYMEIDSNGVNLVSTDGKRLALAHNGVDIGAIDGVKGYIIPVAAVAMIGAQKDEFLDFGFSEKNLTVTAGDVTVRTKLIDGNFPNFRNIIPENFKHSVTLDGDTLFAKNDLVSLASKELAFATFTFNGDKLTIDADENGESIVDVMSLGDDNKFFEKPEKLLFNPVYIAAAIKACGDGKFLFHFNDGLSPAMFEFDGAKTVIMPIRPKGAASDTEEEKAEE